MGLLLINLQHNTVNNSTASEYKQSNHEDTQKWNAGLPTLLLFIVLNGF